MTSLCKRLDDLWEENHGCVILFTWIQFLKEEVVDFLSIKSPLEIHRGKSSEQHKKSEPAGIVSHTTITIYANVCSEFFTEAWRLTKKK